MLLLRLPQPMLPLRLPQPMLPLLPVVGGLAFSQVQLRGFLCSFTVAWWQWGSAAMHGESASLS
jgi:hypothetical protein